GKPRPEERGVDLWFNYRLSANVDWRSRGLRDSVRGGYYADACDVYGFLVRRP
ncbi:hypothetical protein LCGC14_2644220, partial [marine sediment metagenome]